MTIHVVRDIQHRDLPALKQLALWLNSVNLPPKDELLQDVIERSIASFTGSIKEPFNREYTFVIEDANTGKVLGTSQLIAQHGTKEAPHIFFEEYQAEHYSTTLDKLFQHKVLRLGFNYDGPTEIGGLVVDPDMRGNPEHLGRQLSFSRFLLIAMLPKYFKPRLLAELLPPFGPQGQSYLWEAFGRRFTGLDYFYADRLSRQNKEFIRHLFPETPIYATLFDKDAQEAIGAVGKASQNACNLLTSIGFSYSHRLDPFDGGPHYEANTKEVKAISNSRRAIIRSSRRPIDSNGPRALIAGMHQPYTPCAQFRAVQTEFVWQNQEEIEVPAVAMKSLLCQGGEEVMIYNL